LSSSNHEVSNPAVLSFLTELDYGVDENKPEIEVVARLGEAALQAWDNQAVLPQGWHLDIEATIIAWVDFLQNEAKKDGACLVVTSNGIARFLPEALDRMYGSSDQSLDTLKLQTGAYVDLTFDDQIEPGGWIMTRWNVRP
jgi:probable phosphoglycerate mutase